MPNNPQTTDVSDWHRYFSMEANNRAWQLSELQRSADEDMEMLDNAHAAAYHWNIIGNELQRKRATMLLAAVHAALGFASSALPLAEACSQFFLNRKTDDWELAFVHSIHAHAAFIAGETEQYLSLYRQAQNAVEAIADEEDRKIVLLTFNQVPVPA